MWDFYIKTDLPLEIAIAHTIILFISLDHRLKSLALLPLVQQCSIRFPVCYARPLHGEQPPLEPKTAGLWSSFPNTGCLYYYYYKFVSVSVVRKKLAFLSSFLSLSFFPPWSFLLPIYTFLARWLAEVSLYSDLSILPYLPYVASLFAPCSRPICNCYPHIELQLRPIAPNRTTDFRQ